MNYSVWWERAYRLAKAETLMTLSCIGAALFLFSILVRVKATYRIDLAVTTYFQKLDHPWLTKFARAATFAGNSSTIILLTLPIGAYLIWKGDGIAAVLLAAAHLSLLVSTAVKHIVDRERPGEKEARIYGGPRWSFSYPSGHSMGAAAFYGFLGALIAVSGPGISWGAWVLGAIPMFIGLSRIYLGAHWFSDVVGGWTGGVWFVFVLTTMYRP
ncbi:phosphatase PAP2 family protein [bacterium]|nr:MAG: phosphatase PAP2 family protein [bacterium]